MDFNSKWRKWNKMRENEQNGINIMWQDGGDWLKFQKMQKKALWRRIAKMAETEQGKGKGIRWKHKKKTFKNFKKICEITWNDIKRNRYPHLQRFLELGYILYIQIHQNTEEIIFSIYWSGEYRKIKRNRKYAFY